MLSETFDFIICLKVVETQQLVDEALKWKIIALTKYAIKALTKVSLTFEIHY